MCEDDFDEFCAIVSGTADALSKKVPSAHGLVIWFKTLMHYDLAAISEAFTRYLRNPDSTSFMPAPAEIIKMLEGSTLDSAMVAWAQVDQAMRRVGPWATVGFDDPLIHRVLQEMGGWIELSKCDDDGWPFRAREFQNRYRGYKQRGETPECPKLLIGHFEAGNTAEMRKTQPPVLLGNPRLALEVMRNGTDKPLLAMTVAAEHLRRLPSPGQREPVEEVDFSDANIIPLKLA